MKKFLAFTAASGLSLVPFLAFAQSGTQITGILAIVQNILNILIPILITLGIVYFIYGVIGYVTAKDEEKRTEARGTMIYGIIGLFVIVSIWGLIKFLGTATGVGQGGTNCLINPTLPGC
ncbi:MAG TPA: hypothetical protein VIH31_00505 [Candidatus Paceibacterota bacterium]